MSGTSANITVDGEGLAQIASQFASQGDQLGTMLTSISQLIESVSTSSWQGAGNAAFQGTMAEWNSSATTVMQTLQSLGQMVTKASGIYSDTDSQISSSFSSAI